ncbi:hypothetical protein [Oceanicoccus sagamiensis]|uniref:DUF2846 domain-containing protein n=1 Tax=Oceanicoccus sagamiensis TaxID=716816 RepID=A0A1X9NA19_9GAMM|nr:hypothetical protein [Oceanicoccus sagamiensis]ARN73282.1 hypothetical protein BST96_03665 [Oceanicoccus sagamiensis]
MKKLMGQLIVIGAVLMSTMMANIALAGEPSADQAKEHNLVIYRGVDRSAMSYRIMVDGIRVGKLSKDAVIGLHLPAGEHVISATDAKRTELMVVVAEGAVTYVSGEVDKRHRLSLDTVEPDKGAVAAMAPAMATIN